MNYLKGDRVTHPKLSDWGIGQVLENSTAESVRVFFLGAGEKTLSLTHVQPIKLAEEDALCPMLDNLSLGKAGAKNRYQSLKESIAVFLENFPQGFYGSKYAEHELDYKTKAHQLARTLFDKDALAGLLQKGSHDEICKRALKLVNATNLIFPNEKMALKDGLSAPAMKQRFAECLFDLLHGDEELKPRFLRFAKVLEDCDAAKWTVASYFPFFMCPDQHMFIKPTVTQHAAELCGQEINYQSHLNWQTYKSVLDFSARLKNEIAELNPRDMIDVQSFMWCIVPGNY